MTRDCVPYIPKAEKVVEIYEKLDKGEHLGRQWNADRQKTILNDAFKIQAWWTFFFGGFTNEASYLSNVGVGKVALICSPIFMAF